MNSRNSIDRFTARRFFRPVRRARLIARIKQASA